MSTYRIYVVVIKVQGREARLKVRSTDEGNALVKGVELAKQRYKTDDIVGVSAKMRECQHCG